MNSISVTRLYDLIAVKMGKDAAENLATFMEQKVKAEVESKATILATKEDLAKVVLATKEDLAEFKLATKAEFAAVRKEIAETKADMMKWMFIFWTTQMVTIFGLIALFIRK